MKSSILKALRSETHAWWAHKALRDSGKLSEAREREHASMRSAVSILRKALATNGAHVSVSRGGTTIHFARGSTVHSHGSLKYYATARVAVCLGIPLIDTTPVESLAQLISLPMIAVGETPDEHPTTWLSRITLEEYAQRASDLGAHVANIQNTAQPNDHRHHGRAA